jgi:hypothetical protein
LTCLANHLQDRQTRDFIWWHLLDAAPIAARIGSGLWGALSIILVLEPVFATAAVLVPGVGRGYASVPVFGGVVWLVLMLFAEHHPSANPVSFAFHLRRSGRARIRVLIVVPILGLILVSLVGLAVGFGRVLFVGLASVLISVLIVMLTFSGWALPPVGPEQGASPRSTLRDDRMVTLGFGLAIGLGGALLGLIVAVLIKTVDVLAVGLAIVAGGWLAVGLVVGLGLMLTRAWPPYVGTRVWLAIRGQLPWQLMHFLEDAHRLGLLRRAGVAYQFRHARLQDHLADSE